MTRLTQTAWTLVATTALLIPRAAETAPPTPRHHVVLWTFDDDAPRPGFLDATKSLGADSVSAAPGSDVTPIAAAGLSWYEDHASGKGTLGLRESDWKPAWDKAWDARKSAWPDAAARSRPLCLRDPAVVKSLEEKTLAAAKRATSGAFAISLEDEPSIGVRANPIDWCLCDRCAAAFRDAMRAKYADVKSLNETWATDYANWDEVRPWTTAAMKARVHGKPSTEWNLAPWMETRAFQDKTFADVLAHLRDVAARAAPGIPCGVTGTQAPSAFGGWDYGLLRSSMSFVEPYDVGLALPICRDLFPKGTIIAQTIFPSGDDDLLPRWRLWRGIARGANATIVWSSHDALTRGANCGLTPYGKALAADLALLSAPDGIGAKLVRAAPWESGAIVLLSQPSIDVRWMLDSEEDGDTWPRRFGSYEATHSTAIAAREAAWRVLGRQGPRFLDVRDARVQEQMGGLRPRVVLAPDLVAVSVRERNILSDLLSNVRRGDVMRMHCMERPGAFDELGRAAEPFHADRLVIDPGFLSAERMHPPGLDASVTRADAGAAPDVEFGVFRDGGTIYVVAVPAWPASSDDAGNATAALPRTTLEWTFRQAGTDFFTVVDLRSGKDLGRIAEWKSTSDAAGGLVFELR